MHSGVEASSLSDILFFLLLFFLMISTMASPQAIKLLLPKASSGKKVPKHSINVSIDANLDWYVERRPVDKSSLKNVIESESKKYNEEVTVVLRVDKGIAVEELVRLVDVVNQLQIPVILATERADK